METTIQQASVRHAGFSENCLIPREDLTLSDFLFDPRISALLSLADTVGFHVIPSLDVVTDGRATDTKASCGKLEELNIKNQYFQSTWTFKMKSDSFQVLSNIIKPYIPWIAIFYFAWHINNIFIMVVRMELTDVLRF